MSNLWTNGTIIPNKKVVLFKNVILLEKLSLQKVNISFCLSFSLSFINKRATNYFVSIIECKIATQLVDEVKTNLLHVRLVASQLFIDLRFSVCLQDSLLHHKTYLS
jgi:hypothetical protein